MKWLEFLIALLPIAGKPHTLARGDLVEANAAIPPLAGAKAASPLAEVRVKRRRRLRRHFPCLPVERKVS